MEEEYKHYHYTLGFPKGLKMTFGIMMLNYSQHALNRAREDSYNGGLGEIVPPTVLDTNKARVLEVGVKDGKVDKVLYRIPYQDGFDLILAVAPIKRLVKTMWINKEGDEHNNLNYDKYSVVKG